MYTLLDSLMNLLVFGFVGLMIWLYFKKDPSADHDTRDHDSTYDI